MSINWDVILLSRYVLKLHVSKMKIVYHLTEQYINLYLIFRNKDKWKLIILYNTLQLMKFNIQNSGKEVGQSEIRKQESFINLFSI